MEGWGWAGSHEVADKGYVFTITSQIASIGAHFHLSISHKAAKSMAILITSRMVNYSWLSASQRNIQPFEGDTSTRGRLSSLRNSHSKSSPGYFQHQHLLDLLVNV